MITNYGQLKKEKKELKSDLRRLKIDANLATSTEVLCYCKTMIEAKKARLAEVQEHLNVHEEIYRERRQNMKEIAKIEKNKIKNLMKKNK